MSKARCHSVRSYAQMLKADIEKADHRGWIDARKENISELQGQFADYQKLQTQYTNDLNGFLKDLASLEKSQANAPLDEKRGNLENSLMRFLSH